MSPGNQEDITEEETQDQFRLVALSADVGRALTAHNALTDMLRGCTEAMVKHLDAAFARIWTLSEPENMLVLQASAGLYTHLNGPHGRVPVGQFKIGRIAQERKPHLTNSVVGDPRVSDQEWARREGMVAFAGYPLIVEDQLVGVAALFARQPLSDATLQALGSAADQIAVGIDRSRTVEALREANERTKGILESITDGFHVVDRDWRFTYLNPQAERIVSRSRLELLGKSIWNEFPEAVGSPFEQQYRRAVAEQISVTFEEFFPPLNIWLEVRAFPFAGGLSVYFRDITDRRSAEAERSRVEGTLHTSEARLRDAQARLEAALSAGGIATWTWDMVADRVVADAGLAQLFSVSDDDASGGKLAVYLQAIHPDDRARVTETIAEAVASRDVYEAEYRVMLPGGTHRWLATRGRVERDTGGRAVALPGVVLDITERVERERRERFLADLAERARGLTDLDEVIADALRSVGQFFDVSRCIFADIDIEADTCTIRPDYRADDTVPSIAGVVPISAFGSFVVTEYAARRAVAVDDVRADPIKAPPETLSAYEAIGIRAHLTVPLVHFDRIVSCISVHNALPRHWVPEEIALLRAVLERTWLTVEVLRQQHALMRGAEEQRVRAEREALLNRIGASLRSSSDPEAVQEMAVTLLGEALGADRCYFALYDLAGGIVHIVRDWYRADLPSIRGTYPFTNTAAMFQELYQGSSASIIADAETSSLSAQTRANMKALQLRSRVSVALADASGLTATLTAAMSDGPRLWTAEEVALMEAAATQLRIGVEAARVQQREHRIAEQLQAALQPELPGTVAGLAVTKHYEAALTEEAGVGGDFYDVFAIEKGRTALIVGDLSGKGLEAAAQVSIVRNMLRAFLYSKGTISEAVTSLNRVLAENNLLTGFSTLFVGAYNSGTRSLNFVNCGQEPALIRRAATGQAEPLPPTGPILGSVENAEYAERTITLARGDALAVFSDGITECGSTRLNMLGIEGVTALFEEPIAPGQAQDAAGVAEYLKRQLIAGVDAAAAGGVMRDDVCLLMAVVTGDAQFPAGS